MSSEEDNAGDQETAEKGREEATVPDSVRREAGPELEHEVEDLDEVETGSEGEKNVEDEEEEDEGEEDEEEEDEEDNEDPYWAPAVEETTRLIGSFGGKPVTALAFNKAGTRFVSGGHDFEVKIWDFRPAARLKPVVIGSVQPSCGAVIKQVEFSPDDQSVLVVAANCQAVVMGKDGLVDRKEGVCVKGDQYIADMGNTRGHVQMLNDGCWRPGPLGEGDGEFITCSMDATVRVWRRASMSQRQTSVIKTRSPANGLKTVPTVCCYSPDGLSIAAGCQDGSLMFWDTRRKFISTSSCVRAAHQKGSDMTALCYSSAGHKLCSRSEDQSCKVWDLRQLRAPLALREELSCGQWTSDCCFSPDGRLVVAGTGGWRDGRGGQVWFMDSERLEVRRRHELEETGFGGGAGGAQSAGPSVLRVRWRAEHLGFTSSDGLVRVGRLAGAEKTATRAGENRGRKRRKKRPCGGVEVEVGAASVSDANSHADSHADSHSQADALSCAHTNYTTGAALARSHSNSGNSGQAIKRIIAGPDSALFRDDWQQQQNKRAAVGACGAQVGPNSAQVGPNRAAQSGQSGHSGQSGQTGNNRNKNQSDSSREWPPAAQQSPTSAKGSSQSSANNWRWRAIAAHWGNSAAAANASSPGLHSATASRMRAEPKRSYKPEAPAARSQASGAPAALRPAGSTLSSYIARSLAKAHEGPAQAQASGQAQAAAAAAAKAQAKAEPPRAGAATGGTSAAAGPV